MRIVLAYGDLVCTGRGSQSSFRRVPRGSTALTQSTDFSAQLQQTAIVLQKAFLEAAHTVRTAQGKVRSIPGTPPYASRVPLWYHLGALLMMQ